MTEQESRSLTWIRVMAMISIVICHLFQAYNKTIGGSVFNIGVQVFLVMSGYLYGYKTITDWKEWSLKRIKKVYFPYIVFLVLVIPLYVLFHIEAIKWESLPFYFANLQGFRLLVGGGFGRIEGLRHVWFITAIMCAYMSTPMLQSIRKKSTIVFPALLFLISALYVFVPLKYLFVISWFYLYALGYLYVNLSKRWKNIFISLLLLVMLSVIIKLHPEDLINYYGMKYRLLHDIGGFIIVVSGVFLMSRIKWLKVPKIIAIFDKYSFHVFLVHFIIFCGPFSMAYLTPYIGLNVFLMLFISAVATFVFIKILDLVNRLILK